MPRRTVLYICHNHPSVRPGGAENYAHELFRAMADRDDYGAVWALRVAQRMNESAARRNESVALGWHGFVIRDRGVPAEVIPPEVEAELRSLLGRFVSPAWIDDRIARH